MIRRAIITKPVALTMFDAPSLKTHIKFHYLPMQICKSWNKANNENTLLIITDRAGQVEEATDRSRHKSDHWSVCGGGSVVIERTTAANSRSSSPLCSPVVLIISLHTYAQMDCWTLWELMQTTKRPKHVARHSTTQRGERSTMPIGNNNQEDCCRLLV